MSPVSFITSIQFLKETSLALVLILSSVTNLHSQDIETKRVQFERSKSSVTLEAKITGEQIVDYILNAQKGQVMNVSMATDNGANYFNIMEPNEEYAAIFNGSTGENMFEGVLEKSGDYRVRVYLMRSAARRNEEANYRLEMIISALDQAAGNHDAKVEGTNYNATGKIPCQTSTGQPTGNCNFGVERQGNGSAMVTITKPDGRTRTIFFEKGSATGYDMSQADPKEFSSSKDADLFIIRIGNERYEIPEAVVFGG